MNALKDCKIVRVQNAAVAGTSTLTSAVVDRSGFESVMFIALLGDSTINSVQTLTAKMNTANSTATPTPTAVTGGSVANTDADGTTSDNKMIIVDVNKPTQQYLFCTLARATANCVVDGIIAILYNGHKKPITADASVIASALAVSQ